MTPAALSMRCGSPGKEKGLSEPHGPEAVRDEGHAQTPPPNLDAHLMRGQRRLQLAACREAGEELEGERPCTEVPWLPHRHGSKPTSLRLSAPG